MKQALVDVSVLILFFNRPEPLEKVFAAIKEARPARLFLYQDGARNEKDLPGMEACRRVIADENIDWECEVKRNYQTVNAGCDPSNYNAQRWAFSLSDKVRIFEDDSIPSVSFIRFCKEMLDRYENDERIAMISGFNIEEQTPDVKEDYFFTTNFSIWGWASWRRVIDQWDEHYTWMDDPQTIAQLKAIIKERGYRNDILPMCTQHRASGKAFYETIFWSHILRNNLLCIVPRRNMINNLGAIADSTHFGGSLETLPHGYRRIFTMKRYELESPIQHPAHIIEHVAYRKRAYKIMGWMNPMIKIGRSFEELFLNLRYGNFRFILQSINKRILKWMGKKAYK